MNNFKFYLKTVVCALFLFACGGKDAETEASPDISMEENPVNINDSDFSDDSKTEITILS